MPADSEDTLRFAELTGVRPMIETYPLEKAAEALRAHDERQGAVPRRSDDVKLAGIQSENTHTGVRVGEWLPQSW